MNKSAIGLVLSAATAWMLSAQVSPKAVRTADEMEPLPASIAAYGIDSAPVSAIASSKGKAKAELILAAGERGTTAAADAPEIVRGSILALSEWANPAPLPDLLAVAKSHANPAFRLLALRGYLKLVGLPSERPFPESARLLADAAQLAKEPAEKRTLLSLAGNYPSKEALQIAESMLNDEAMAREAKAAADRINGALRRTGVPR